MDTDGWRHSAEVAAEAIGRAFAGEDPEQVVVELSRAERVLGESLREAMAAAVLAGSSMRRVAEITGLAPNSVPPRLARSKSLSPYADEGTITAAGITLARYQVAPESVRPPMTFKPRRKDPK